MSKTMKVRTEHRPASPQQISLLDPPQSHCLPPDGRLAHLGSAIRAACVEAMRPCRLSRWEIAGKVSQLLEREVSKSMLDAYCAESHDTHRIPADVLAALCLVCESDRPLQVLAESADCAVVRIPAGGGAVPADVRAGLLDVVRELGQAVGKIEQSLSDERLTDAELRDCEREVWDVIRAAVTVGQRLKVCR